MTMFTQIREHRERFMKSLAMFTVFLVYGLTSGLLGPTMLDLQLRVNGTIEQVAYILPGRSIGIIAGSLIIGLLNHRINFQLLAVVCMTITMICNVVIPLNIEYIGLIGTFLVNGFVGGLLGAGANMFMIEMWGKENGPFLQALHFCYGLGALIAPLIGRPFLLPLDGHVEADVFGGNATSDVLVDTVTYTQDDVLLIYPYSIVAAFHLIPISFFIVLYRLHPQTSPHPSRLVVIASPVGPDVVRTEAGIQGMDQMKSITEQAVAPSNFWKNLMICLITLFMPCAYGIELTYGSYLTTFAVKSGLHLDKSTGAYMTSLYWTMFTFFRLSTVFYIDIIGPENNIIMNTCLIIISNIIIFPFGDSSPTCLWIGTLIMGIGNSSIFASVFGFMENYFPVTNRVASTLMISSFCGEFVFPVIISRFMESRPTIFLEVTLACSVAMALLFAATSTLAHFKMRCSSSQEKKIAK